MNESRGSWRGKGGRPGVGDAETGILLVAAADKSNLMAILRLAACPPKPETDHEDATRTRPEARKGTLKYQPITVQGGRLAPAGREMRDVRRRSRERRCLS